MSVLSHSGSITFLFPTNPDVHIPHQVLDTTDQKLGNKHDNELLSCTTIPNQQYRCCTKSSYMHDVFSCMGLLDHQSGSKDLLKVLEEIKDVNDEWKFLGLALGLVKATLDSIKSNGYEECKMEMIEKWLNKVDPDCNPSWGSLVAAVRSPLVQHNPIAEAIKSKYLHS